MKLRTDEPRIWATTFCNMGHRMDTGQPVKHECATIPPRLLRLERDAMSDNCTPEQSQARDDAWGEWSRARYSRSRSY